MDSDLVLAHRLADLADTIALDHYGRPGQSVRIKADGSQVGAADHEIELAMRALIARERPDDAFLGEEFGAQSGSGHRCWIIDPIDGTASFLAGEPEWGALIALEQLGGVALGLVSAPALRRRWWAAPGGGSWSAAWPSAPGAPARQLSVTRTARTRDAVVAIWPPPHRLTARERGIAAQVAAEYAGIRPALDWAAVAVADATTTATTIRKPSTGSGVCHGALLVATGQVDAFLLLGAGRWDVAALIPIVEEAGGAYADLSTAPGSDHQAALFSNSALLEQILRIARP